MFERLMNDAFDLSGCWEEFETLYTRGCISCITQISAHFRAKLTPARTFRPPLEWTITSLDPAQITWVILNVRVSGMQSRFRGISFAQLLHGKAAQPSSQ